MAKVNYKGDGDEKEEQIIMADDWIIDPYGSHLFTKLVDRRMNDEFLKYPPTKDGKLAMLRFGEENIERVKYCSTVKNWKGLLDNGKVVVLQEEYIKENFGKRFIQVI